jgi:hypothetical protein
MEYIELAARAMKGAIDFQLATFSSGVRPAAMFITAFDGMLIYLAFLFGTGRKPANNEMYWVAGAIIALAWVVSDAYLFALSVGG